MLINTEVKKKKKCSSTESDISLDNLKILFLSRALIREHGRIVYLMNTNQICVISAPSLPVIPAQLAAALTPAEQHPGLPGGCAHIASPPGSVMCCVWVSHQLQPCATAGLSALVLQSSRCLGFTGCTCTWVCSSGCLLCAWGGAGLAQKEWMGGPGAAAV